MYWVNIINTICQNDGVTKEIRIQKCTWSLSLTVIDNSSVTKLFDLTDGSILAESGKVLSLGVPWKAKNEGSWLSFGISRERMGLARYKVFLRERKKMEDPDWVCLFSGDQIAAHHFLNASQLVIVCCSTRPPMHNVHFGYYVFLPTEQAETYLKRCVLINYSTYICLCLFGWKENMINEETVSSKL